MVVQTGNWISTFFHKQDSYYIVSQLLCNRFCLMWEQKHIYRVTNSLLNATKFLERYFLAFTKYMMLNHILYNISLSHIFYEV